MNGTAGLDYRCFRTEFFFAFGALRAGFALAAFRAGFATLRATGFLVGAFALPAAFRGAALTGFFAAFLTFFAVSSKPVDAAASSFGSPGRSVPW